MIAVLEDSVCDMPIYEYQCGECNLQFELLIRGKEKPVCPECKGKQVTKQLSVIASPNSETQTTCAEQPMMGGG